MTTAEKALAAHIHCEVKKHAYRQVSTRDGDYVAVTLLIHPDEVPPTLATARLGTRYMAVLVELDDKDQPVKRADPALINSMSDLRAALIASMAIDMTDAKVEKEDKKIEPLRAHLSSVGKQRYAAASDMERARTDAVMRCKDPRFWRWAGVGDEAGAATFVREALAQHVGEFSCSRSKIAHDLRAYQAWKILETEFLVATGQMPEMH